MEAIKRAQTAILQKHQISELEAAAFQRIKQK
jgi:hypothetical protein